MKEAKKMAGEARRAFILKSLRETQEPITGTTFAKKTNVSRQVIVQDVSLLKAKNEPIIATSQGYMYMKEQQGDALKQLVIACKHTPEQTREELNIIVDHGVTVRDVKIEHAVYGDLTASIMVSNRKEVDQFVDKIEETNASYLAPLTGGIHLHTLEADSEDKIEAACKALAEAGILLDD